MLLKQHTGLFKLPAACRGGSASPDRRCWGWSGSWISSRFRQRKF